MAKLKPQFACSACGAIHPKWMGKCPDCGTWDALEQVSARDVQAIQSQSEAITSASRALTLEQAIMQQDAGAMRLSTGIDEFDRVLGGAPSGEPSGESSGAPSHAPGVRVVPAAGGQVITAAAGVTQGLVPGAAVLLGGDPGVGKSTLMLQAALALTRAGQPVLYVTSEESASQLALRAKRLIRGGHDAVSNLMILAETQMPRVLEQARKLAPRVMIVDSVQMVHDPQVSSAPGSVTQLRAACLELLTFAKQSHCCVVMVGHVTKQGQLAGPRLLEHMVDVVLYFEGDRYHHHRILRAIKNRFGRAQEVGLFQMSDSGLEQVVDAQSLLAEYRPNSGSVVCPVMTGSRCLMVEIQALTAPGLLGAAKRKTSGLDANRVAMLIAVLERRAGLRLADQDVFASCVGGVKIVEPAADLAIALAIASAHQGTQMPRGFFAVGEIGLGGEVRTVSQLDTRISQAQRLGFGYAVAAQVADGSAPRDPRPDRDGQVVRATGQKGSGSSGHAGRSGGGQVGRDDGAGAVNEGAWHHRVTSIEKAIEVLQ